MSYHTLLTQIKVPPYSKKQELFNVISHLLGLPLAFYIYLFALSRYLNDQISFFSYSGLAIFALAVFLLYTFSVFYHCLSPTSFNKKIFRIIDHAAIFLLIAGTYTPICFYLISGGHPVGLVIFIIEVIAATLGILLNVFLFHKDIVRIFSIFLYILMGWLIIFTGGFSYLDFWPFIFILIGGIVYTIGVISYAVGKKKLYFHSIFHIFVLVATVTQMIGVLLLFS